MKVVISSLITTQQYNRILAILYSIFCGKNKLRKVKKEWGSRQTD